MEFYIKQSISILTALLAVVMMQFKSMKMILLGQITVNLLAASTFFLFGGRSGGGMGTSGFVGVFDLIENTQGALGYVGIVLLMLVLPAILNWLISEFMRKKGWIKDGDMKLPE